MMASLVASGQELEASGIEQVRLEEAREIVIHDEAEKLAFCPCAIIYARIARQNYT